MILKKFNRREFLRRTSLATAGTLLVPRFLKALDNNPLRPLGQRKLVIVQLGGGNDGLNTVVPYGDDAYYNARTRIAIPKNEVLPLDGYHGFHPALAPLRELFDHGELAVLNGVGYPEPNRSHFRSMDIWQSGSGAKQYWETGWVGRYLDGIAGELKHPVGAIEVSQQLSMVMKGKTHKGLAVSDPQRFYKTNSAPRFKHISKAGPHDHDHHQASYLYQTLAQGISAAEYIQEKTRLVRPGENYTLNPMSRQLRTVAQMIKSGLETSVYYVGISGFDTHVNQPAQHKRLLGNVAQGLADFRKDLLDADKWQDTLVMVFSEFGRRVQQNASNGTDHGTASNLYLLGGNIKQPGLFNKIPSLTDLDKGDLKFHLDFRRVYAEVLQNWLKTDARKVLQADFKPLGIVG